MLELRTFKRDENKRALQDLTPQQVLKKNAGIWLWITGHPPIYGHMLHVWNIYQQLPQK
jgi:hypothetical protein